MMPSIRTVPFAEVAPEAVTIRNLHKRFGATHALKGVNLTIRGGRVHALLGANGCGKSTLVKILSGYHQPDGGEIETAPGDAGAIAFVHQDLGLVPTLTVCENLGLAAGFHMGGTGIAWRRQRAATQELLEQNGVNCAANDTVGSLGPAEQTMIAIMRAVSSLPAASGVLVLDEPTARLPASEAKRLLTMIQRLKARGVAILYISHRLDEILEIGDEVTILRDGACVFAGEVQGLDRKTLVRHIVGRDLEPAHAAGPDTTVDSGPELVRLDNLSGIRLRNVSLTLHKGEILGIVGLVGSGRSELGRMVFGLQKPFGGKIFYRGRDVTGQNPRQLVAQGMGYVPQERRQGVFGTLSVGENAVLADLPSVMGPFGYSTSLARAAAEKVVRDFRVKTDGINAAIATLSGGNQQKVSLGKWLRRDVSLMLLDEPTQGIDIGARTEIFHIIRDMARERGIGALVLDSDLEILAEHCDRVLVMVRGRITREFRGAELTATALSHEVYGH